MGKTNTIGRLSAIIDSYVMPADTIFPLCSESLTYFLGRIAGATVGEEQLVECLSILGYKPLTQCGAPRVGIGRPAWFRIRFVRDEATAGLFGYFDETLCGSRYLRFILSNAKCNTDRRMRDFCSWLACVPELCRRDIADADVIDYLGWLARHAPSTKSSFAATLLYYMSDSHDWTDKNLSADQQQFIRENPSLKPCHNQC